jgi:cytochrome c553
MKKFLAVIAALGTGLAVGAAAHAADPVHGKELVERTNCAACHGPGLAKPASTEFPKLAGQHADYLFYAMRQYQTGAGNSLFGRNNPIMQAQVQNLSEDDLQDIASYIASLPGDLVTKK